MQLSINARTAQGILQERNRTVAELRQLGRIELSANVFITLVGKRRYTLLDLSSAAGEGIADLVPAYDRHLVPAWQEDKDGTREDRQTAERYASFRHQLIHG
jgi:hypothetical protein